MASHTPLVRRRASFEQVQGRKGCDRSTSMNVAEATATTVANIIAVNVEAKDNARVLAEEAIDLGSDPADVDAEDIEAGTGGSLSWIRAPDIDLATVPLNARSFPEDGDAWMLPSLNPSYTLEERTSTSSQVSSDIDNQGLRSVQKSLKGSDGESKTRHDSKTIYRTSWSDFASILAGTWANVSSVLAKELKDELDRIRTRVRQHGDGTIDSVMFASAAISLTALAFCMRTYLGASWAEDRAKLTAAWTSSIQLGMRALYAMMTAVTAMLQYMLAPVARSLGWFMTTHFGVFLQGQFELGRGEGLPAALTTSSTGTATVTATRTIESHVQPTMRVFVAATPSLMKGEWLIRCKPDIIKTLVEAMREAGNDLRGGRNGTGSSIFERVFECDMP